MSPELRAHLRAAIDRRRRELVASSRDKPPEPASVARRLRRQAGLIDVRTHGRGGYANGCRCDECRAGRRAYLAGRP